MSTPLIKVMLSSTIADLKQERESIGSRLRDTGLVEIVGMQPGTTPSRGSSSYLETSDLASDCDVYLLVLANRYGYQTDTGKSATETEYRAAYRSDPTKILVLKKSNSEAIEPKQRKFIKTVEDYHRGYFVQRFVNPAEAGLAAQTAFLHWLRDRAAIGRNLDYFDHFIRIACQRTPFPGSKAYYQVADDRVELTYYIQNKIYSAHYGKIELYKDFWGCVSDLQTKFERWLGND